MVVLNNLSMAQEVKIGDHIYKFDSSDRRFVNRVLKLIKNWQNIDAEIEERKKEFAGITDAVDRLIAISDAEIEILEKLKEDVNNVFGCPITDWAFGEGVLPDITRYAGLFDMITPLVHNTAAKEADLMKSLNEKYGFNADQPTMQASEGLMMPGV